MNNEITSAVLLVCSIIGTAICSIACIKTVIITPRYDNNARISAFAGLIVFIAMGALSFYIRDNVKIETVETKVNENYEIYLDGEPVELDNIDIKYYQMTVDNENEKIYLTKKNDSNWIFIPIH